VVVEEAKPVEAAPLIIVGTHVTSDTNDIAKLMAANAAPPPPTPTPTPAPAPAPAAPASPPTAAVGVQPAPIPAPPAQPAPVVTQIVNPPPVAQVAPLPAPAPAPPPVVAVVPAPAPVVVTNIVAATDMTHEDLDTKVLTYVGVGLLGAAIVLVIFLIARPRHTPHGSLITSSMQADQRPPEKK